LAKISIRIPAGWARYFRENLGAPSIIAFQVMLLFCAFLLIRGYSALANDVAVYAFYSLVVRVVFQLVSFLRHPEKTA
jgi:hypothetical protein